MKLIIAVDLNREYQSQVLKASKDILTNFAEKIQLSTNSINKYRLVINDEQNALLLEQNTYAINVNLAGEIYLLGEASYGDTLIMPEYNLELDGFRFISWSYNNINYAPGDSFVVVGKYDILPVYEQYKYNLTINYNGNQITSTKMYEDGEVIALEELIFVTPNQRLLGFSYKGKEYSLASSITLDVRYLELEALVKTTSNLQIQINDEIIELPGYLTGDVVNLAALKEELGYDITSFIYNGITYSISEEIVLDDDFKIIVVLANENEIPNDGAPEKPSDDETNGDDEVNDQEKPNITDNFQINKEFIIVAVISIIVVIGLATVLVLIYKKEK